MKKTTRGTRCAKLPASIGVGAGHDTGGVEFWHGAERAGWLMKQGEIIKTWRRRWFVLKEGKMFWFLDQNVTAASADPRGHRPVQVSQRQGRGGRHQQGAQLRAQFPRGHAVFHRGQRQGEGGGINPPAARWFAAADPRRGRLRRVLATGRPSVRGEDRCKNTPNDVRTTPARHSFFPTVYTRDASSKAERGGVNIGVVRGAFTRSAPRRLHRSVPAAPSQKRPRRLHRSAPRRLRTRPFSSSS